MKTLAVMPRGGLGDVLYHALFARYVHKRFPDFDPVILAPKYAAFLTALLHVRHVPVCSALTDASAGLHLGAEAAFWAAFYKLRGSCLASFTNDVVDHGVARLFQMSLFDGGILGNSMTAVEDSAGRFSRSGLNRLLAAPRSGRVNPKHIVDRQQYAIAHFAAERSPSRIGLPEAYREIWSSVMSDMGGVEVDKRLVLLFPETARTEKNLSFGQIESVVRQIDSEYSIRIFTRTPELYKSLDVDTVGFADKLEPLRQIRQAAAVISADTFSAHLAGLCCVPTYVIYNFAYRRAWCEYWGSPFQNVFNFERGACYQLDEYFQASQSSQDSLLFNAVLKASGGTLAARRHEELVDAGILTGSGARS